MGYPLARAWWEVRSPLHRGALVAVWAGGRLLLVRQSYQGRAAFPGGGVGHNEHPRDAAHRELIEELGLDAPPSAMSLACETTQRWDGRRDTVTFFELHLAREPSLRVDLREIVSAAFYDPSGLPARISNPVAHYLRWRTTIPATTAARAG